MHAHDQLRFISLFWCQVKTWSILSMPLHQGMTSGAVVRDSSTQRLEVFIKGSYEKVKDRNQFRACIATIKIWDPWGTMQTCPKRMKKDTSISKFRALHTLSFTCSSPWPCLRLCLRTMTRQDRKFGVKSVDLASWPLISWLHHSEQSGRSRCNVPNKTTTPWEFPTRPVNFLIFALDELVALPSFVSGSAFGTRIWARCLMIRRSSLAVCRIAVSSASLMYAFACIGWLCEGDDDFAVKHLHNRKLASIQGVTVCMTINVFPGVRELWCTFPQASESVITCDWVVITELELENDILYYTILYYTIPYHIIPYQTIPYHIISYHIISYHTIPYHTTSYHIIPHHTISYHIIPYPARMYYIILYTKYTKYTRKNNLSGKLYR